MTQNQMNGVQHCSWVDKIGLRIVLEFLKIYPLKDSCNIAVFSSFSWSGYGNTHVNTIYDIHNIYEICNTLEQIKLYKSFFDET